MASGLDWMSSFCISWARSRSRSSWGASSMATMSTVGEAAICIAMSCTSSMKWSPRATKSVSQFTSTSTPSLRSNHPSVAAALTHSITES